jgi:hypothetical protein
MIDLKARIATADPAVFGDGFDPAKPTLADAQRALDATLDANDTFGPVGKGRDVYLCLPQYKASNPATLFSLLALWDKAVMRAKMHFGDAMVSHTRNKLASAFLASESDWALFVDDDMVLPIGDAAWFKGVTNLDLPDEVAGRHTLKRLLSHGKTLVGGMYFGRSPRGKPMFFEGATKPDFATSLRDRRRAGELLPTRWVGTGCLLVHRKVFLDIRAKFTHLEPKTGSGDDFPYFTPHPDRLEFALAELAAAKSPAATKTALAKATEASATYRHGIGEDVTFCARAAYVGHQPFVDTGLVCGHVGSHAYGPSNTTND